MTKIAAVGELLRFMWARSLSYEVAEGVVTAWSKLHLALL